MRDEQLENAAEDVSRTLMPRAMPDARFVRDLDQEIRRAARQRMERMGIRAPFGSPQGMPFEEMVVELRKLVRLLCKTLVPVEPRLEYARELGERLQAKAAALDDVRQRQWQWLMVGGLVGSLVSLLGLVAALLLRRRNGRLHTNKPIGVT